MTLVELLRARAEHDLSLPGVEPGCGGQSVDRHRYLSDPAELDMARRVTVRPPRSRAEAPALGHIGHTTAVREVAPLKRCMAVSGAAACVGLEQAKQAQQEQD
jgi:hypothetical protein